MNSYLGLLLFSFSGVVLAQSHADLGKLEDYPMVSRAWLGSLVGDVQVDPEFPLELSAATSIVWKVEDGTTVAADQVIAEVNVEKLQLTKSKLELKKVKRSNELRDLEIKNVENRKALKKQIDELESLLSQMKLTDTEAQILGKKFSERMEKERKLTEEERDRLKQKLESNYFEVAHDAERENLDLEIKQAELDYEELLRNSEILAPEAGRLEIDVREPFRKTTVVGKIIQEGSAEVVLEMADVRINNLKSSELEIEMNGQDGKMYVGSYLRTLEQTSVRGNEKILVFDLKGKQEGQAVRKELHGRNMIRVYRRLEKPAYSVPKQDLVFRFPKEIDSEGWAAFFEKRWSGIQVSYVAPREVIIQARNEN